jgi:ribosomal protein S18 acetylase RimI-like enzyme
MRKSDPFDVKDLNSVGLTKWFDVGPQPPDLNAAVRQLSDLMAPDEMKRPFRTVAIDGNDSVRAKLGGYITSFGRLTFWAARYRDGEDPSTRRELARLLIESCIARARETPNVRFLETKPAYDTPDLDIFLSEINAAGLHEVAVSHLYTLKLCSVRELRISPLPGLECRESVEIAAPRFERLFADCQIGTLDRAQRDSPLSAQETIQELRSWAGSAAMGPLWSVAMLARQPVGFALSGVSGPRNGPPEEATIAELGILPDARRKGIGSWLVREILWYMREAGVVTARVLIDNENIPSQRLHERIGFTREFGEYRTWRCLVLRSGAE